MIHKIKNYSRRLKRSFEDLGIKGGTAHLLRYILNYPFRRKGTITYAHWLRLEPASFEQLESAATTIGNPRIGICILVTEMCVKELERTILSVGRQRHTNWELHIGTWHILSREVDCLLEQLTEKHDKWRIRLHLFDSSLEDADAINKLFEQVGCKWIVLLDQHDELSPHTCQCISYIDSSEDKCQLIYSDEDMIDVRGRRHSPYYKPSYNPELLTSNCLFINILAINKDLYNRVGGFRVEYGSAYKYDFVLRACNSIDERQIVHIPRILYHRRSYSRNTQKIGIEATLALNNLKLVLKDYLDRKEINAIVEVQSVHSIRISYAIPSCRPLVSMIIPTREESSMTEKLINGIEQNTDYDDIEIILIDNGSTSAEFQRFSNRFLSTGSSKIAKRIIRDNSEFNYSKLNNKAAVIANGEYLCLMNNDIEIVQSSWLSELVSIGIRKEVGVVGPLLLYPDLTIQHAGIILGINGWAGHIYKGSLPTEGKYCNQIQTRANYSAVTGACLLTPKKVWNELGGLNEKELKVACNDVDYCLRVWKSGKQVVYTPYAYLIHHESKTRGYDLSVEKMRRFAQELGYMQMQWCDVLYSDPFYNPNLSMLSEDGSLLSNHREEVPIYRLGLEGLV